MDCSDLKDDLLEVLYGEASADTRERLQDHQRGCAACRDEWTAMQRVRRDLAEWRVPEESRSRPARSLGSRLGFSRGLAAAAVLLLSLGGAVGLAGIEFRFEKGPVQVRLGRRSQTDDVQRVLAEQEKRHLQQIAALTHVDATSTASPASAGDDVLLRRVQQLIQESEARQATTLRVGLRELSERTAAQRRYDLARVSAGLSYLDGKTGQQVARTTELMGYVLQASQKR